MNAYQRERARHCNKFYYNEDFNFEYKDVYYVCGVDAGAIYNYTPGSMYNRYGDPGDAPDVDFDMVYCDSWGFEYEDTGEEIADPKLIEILQDVVAQEVEDIDIDHWSGD